MSDYTEYLISFAKEFDIFSSITTSTTALSKQFNKSQQSTSRILIEMEKVGLLNKTSSTEGVKIELTQKGITELNNTYNALKNHFEKEATIIKGKITDGLGEGKYYISLNGYQKQFQDKLSIKPYPGTLNLKINKEKINTIRSLYKPITIDGFVTKERTFGKLDCYRCKIENKIHAFIILIERTTHENDIIEIISEKHIRNELPNKEDLKITLSK